MKVLIATGVFPPESGGPATYSKALLDELPRLEARVGYFATLANLATLFGLMGTVTGLRVGFGCVPNHDAASRATMFAKSISESLNCTAFGLFTPSAR